VNSERREVPLGDILYFEITVDEPLIEIKLKQELKYLNEKEKLLY
jgi:hypothetical protein